MSPHPLISVVLSTYQRPAHLRRSLISLSHQRDVDGQFEVVVADDGSTDSTAEMVRDFARTAKFPLGFTSKALDPLHTDAVQPTYGPNPETLAEEPKPDWIDWEGWLYWQVTTPITGCEYLHRFYRLDGIPFGKDGFTPLVDPFMDAAEIEAVLGDQDNLITTLTLDQRGDDASAT